MPKPDTLCRSLAIGNPADGNFAVATAKASHGAIYSVAEEQIGQNMALLAETSGVFGETAAGARLGDTRGACWWRPARMTLSSSSSPATA